jgi:hypothetical protein
MTDMVQYSEPVPPLSPSVTPLPFYRRPIAYRQLAVVVFAMFAMTAGVLHWGQVVLSVPEVATMRASRVEWILSPAEPPAQIELVVVGVHMVDDPPLLVETTPCL